MTKESDDQGNPAVSGIRSLRAWVAFLLGVGGLGAAELIGGDILVLVVIMFVAGIAGALVASGSARIWAPLLGAWVGLAGYLTIRFVLGETNEWSLLVPFALVVLAPPVVAGAAAVIAIRNIRQLRGPRSDQRRVTLLHAKRRQQASFGP